MIYSVEHNDFERRRSGIFVKVVGSSLLEERNQKEGKTTVKNIKKIITFALVCVLAMALLTGCYGSNMGRWEMIEGKTYSSVYCGVYNGNPIEWKVVYDPDQEYAISLHAKDISFTTPPAATAFRNTILNGIENDAIEQLKILEDPDTGKYYPIMEPVFDLINFCLLTKAVGGKVSGSTGPDGLVAWTYDFEIDYSYKLTLYDKNRAGFQLSFSDNNIYKEEEGYNNWSLSFSYSDAKSGSSDYISVIIEEILEGEEIAPVIRFYGHVDAGKTSGDVTFNIPELTAGKYRVSAFNETINGDYLTDFTSDRVFVDIEVVETADESSESSEESSESSEESSESSEESSESSEESSESSEESSESSEESSESSEESSESSEESSKSSEESSESSEESSESSEESSESSKGGRERAEISYFCQNGDDLIWNGGDLELTVKRSEHDELTFGLYAGADIDGVPIEERYLTASRGSLRLRLSEKLLKGLASGKHTLTVRFMDGEVRIGLVIKTASGVKGAPDTGVSCAPLAAVGIAAMAGLAVLVFRKK